MPWIPRLLVRRSSAQAPVLAGVTALAVAASALLGALAALLSGLDGPATGALLDRAEPQDVALRVTLDPTDPFASPGVESAAANQDGRDAAVDGAVRALERIAGDVPLDVSVWRTSEVYQVSADRFATATYVTALPEGFPVRAVDGEVPGPDAEPATAKDSARVLPVAVPRALAEAEAWTVGRRVVLHDTTTDGTVTIEVTGVYEPGLPRSAWTLDQLGGAGYDPEFFLVRGQAVLQLHGPLITTPAALAAAGVPVGEARVSAVPDLSGTTASAAAAIAGRAGLGDALVAKEVGDLADVEFTTRFGQVVAGLELRLGAVRGVVLLSGLVLLVVAGAALQLVARLVAEQRSAGLELMAARGASRGQLLRLTVAEAAVIAVVVALVAPWPAAGLYRATAWLIAWADDGAGGAAPAADVGPGDPMIRLACAASAVVLASLLVVPLLRPGNQDGFEADAPTVRPGRGAALRAALLRSGGTVVLAALAGVAVWQLGTYRSPAAGGAVDPVVVVAPALLLLATALVSARSLPLLARLTDRFAARSRGLALPLAAWETGRRPARAAGTALLLTLAVAVAVAVPPTVATWRTSQIDQTELAVGAPLRLADVPGTALGASAAVAAATRDTPAGLRPVNHGLVTLTGAHGEGRSVRAVALDDATALRGRVVEARGPEGVVVGRTWDDVAALLDPSGPAGSSGAAEPSRAPGSADPGPPATSRPTPAPFPAGIELPAGTVTLSADTHASAAITIDQELAGEVRESHGREAAVARPPRIDGSLRIDVVLEDERGVREQRTLAAHEFRTPTGTDKEIEVPLNPDGSPLAEPLRLVGMTVSVLPYQVAPPPGADAATVHFRLDNVALTDTTGTVRPLDLGAWQALRLPEIPGVSFLRGGPIPADTRAASLGITLRNDAETYLLHGARYVLSPGATPVPGTVADAPAPLPAVVSAGVARDAGVGVGDRLVIDGAAPLALEVAGVVRHLPGGTGEGVLLRRNALEAARFASGVPLEAPDEWWGVVSDDDAAPLATALADTGTVRTLAAERSAALTGPLEQAVPAALGLLAAASVLLAGAGVAAAATAGLRLRRLEIARLQALGVPRRLLVRAVLAENGLLAAVGLLAGGAAGAALAAVLAPATALGPDGGPPVPEAVAVVPWGALFLLLAATAAVVAATVSVTAGAQVRRASADLLRLGADR